MKTLSASKAAEMIVAGMEKDAYRVLVGRDSKFMDFIYRVHPQRAAAFINCSRSDLTLEKVRSCGKTTPSVKG